MTNRGRIVIAVGLASVLTGFAGTRSGSAAPQQTISHRSQATCGKARTVTVKSSGKVRRVKSILCPTPAAVIQDFYRSINSRNYKRAYGLFSLHLRPPYAFFLKNYATTPSIRVARIADPRYRIRIRHASTWWSFTCPGVALVTKHRDGSIRVLGGWAMTERLLPDVRKMGWRIVPYAGVAKAKIGVRAPSRRRCNFAHAP